MRNPAADTKWYSGRTAMTDGSITMVRDVMAVRLRRNGASWRFIAALLNTPATTIRDRIDGLDPDVEAIYAATPLDSLGL